MKMRLISLIAAAALLCGCSGEWQSIDLPEGLFSEKSSRTESEITSSDIPLSDSTAPNSTVSDTDSLFNMSVEICLDPKNKRTLRFSNGTVMIFGDIGEDGLEEIWADGSRTDIRRSGTTFECELPQPLRGTGYSDITIINKLHQPQSFRIAFSNGRYSFPDVLDIAENNLAAVSNNVPDDSEAVILQNITINGTRSNAEKVLEQIRELSYKICRGLSNDYSKLRAISRWVSRNIYYDHPASSAGIPQECLSLEYMLKNKRSVCGGYANMTAALAQAQGITCYSIRGEGVTNSRVYTEVNRGEFHEWNYAIIDGRGVWIDSGWNSYNSYSLRAYRDGEIGTKYFDIGNELFALDHKVNKVSNRDFFSIEF